MKPASDILKSSAEFLEKKGIQNGRKEAEHLLCHTLKLSRLDLYTSLDRPLEEKELEKIRELLRRRGQREPLAYILGIQPFHNCQIKVDRRVLVPRPETEELVQKVLDEIPARNLRILDLCCGSGCIGIALKKELPNSEVTLADISPKALELAKENADLNEVEVNFHQGDLCQDLKGPFDLICCNPPYVSEEEYKTLEPELHFEPKGALVAPNRGLEIYQRLAKELPKILKGRLYMEIGADQANEILQSFTSPWKDTKVFKDFFGKDRILTSRLNS